MIGKVTGLLAAALILVAGAGCGESNVVKEAKELSQKACDCKDAECYRDAVEKYTQWAASKKDSDVTKADYQKIEAAHKKVLECAKSVVGPP